MGFELSFAVVIMIAMYQYVYESVTYLQHRSMTNMTIRPHLCVQGCAINTFSSSSIT